MPSTEGRRNGLTVALLGTVISTGREMGQSGGALFSVQIWPEKNQGVPQSGGCFGKRYAWSGVESSYFDTFEKCVRVPR